MKTYYAGSQFVLNENAEFLIQCLNIMMSTMDKMTKRRIPPRDVESLFLDSGAFTLYFRELRKVGPKKAHDFYRTKEFRQYLDDYAAFVNEFGWGIDYYANVDVLYSPELSWESLKYLESKGLHPVPVLHYGAPMKWVHKHLDAGYEFIGLGGRGKVPEENYLRWTESVFDILCDTPNRCPKVRTHGFAMTSFDLMRRFPWWSVDSASWEKMGSFGSIMVPRKRIREGKKVFVFDIEPTVITCSEDSPAVKKGGHKHYWSLTQDRRRDVDEWLEYLGVPLGKPAKGDSPTEFGVLTRHIERKIVNLHYFEHFRKTLPEYPWPFHPQKRATLGIFKRS